MYAPVSSNLIPSILFLFSLVHNQHSVLVFRPSVCIDIPFITLGPELTKHIVVITCIHLGQARGRGRGVKQYYRDILILISRKETVRVRLCCAIRPAPTTRNSPSKCRGVKATPSPTLPRVPSNNISLDLWPWCEYYRIVIIAARIPLRHTHSLLSQSRTNACIVGLCNYSPFSSSSSSPIQAEYSRGNVAKVPAVM